MVEDPDWQTATDAFSCLSSEQRVRIVEALGEVAVETPPEDIVYGTIDGSPVGLTYSELQSAVGIRDNGRFNYHLDELRDTFVEKQGDTYRLTWFGRYAFDMIARWSADTADSAVRSFSSESTCLDCGTALDVRYTTEQLLYITCRDCEIGYKMMGIPPRAIGTRSSDQILDIADAYARGYATTIARRVCDTCGGELDFGLMGGQDYAQAASDRPQPVAVCRCRSCGQTGFPTVGELVVPHPAYVAFSQAHDRDPRDTYIWDLPVAATSEAVTVHPETPLRIEVVAELDGDRLTVTLDEAMAVCDVCES